MEGSLSMEKAIEEWPVSPKHGDRLELETCIEAHKASLIRVQSFEKRAAKMQEDLEKGDFDAEIV